MEEVADVRLEVDGRIRSGYLSFVLATRHLLPAAALPWNLS